MLDRKFDNESVAWSVGEMKGRLILWVLALWLGWSSRGGLVGGSNAGLEQSAWQEEVVTARQILYTSEEWVSIDGNRIAERHSHAESLRRSIELQGYACADSNSLCGRECWLFLHSILNDGGLFVENIVEFDEQGLALARAETSRGSDLATMMVRQGYATAVDEDLIGLEEEARRSRRGCISTRRELKQFETTAESESAVEAPSLMWNTTNRLTIEPDFPVGFKKENFLDYQFSRPVDFDFRPGRQGRDIIVAENKGRVKLVRDGVISTQLVMDVTSIINRFQDRGVMSLAFPPNHQFNSEFYLFFVFEHKPGVEFVEDPKTSTVLRTVLSESTEDPSQRQFILGTLHGDGCSDFPIDADCIPAEGKSHVGGGLIFGTDAKLFVSIGDGGRSTINPQALRSQSLDYMSGSILRVDRNGRGFRNNPFSGGYSLSHPRSKIWATGMRNPLRIHVSPNSNTRLFCGDTQWASEEEVNLIKPGENCGWPCFEANIERQQYADFDECRDVDPATLTFPLISWPHRPGGTHSSMVGPKINIPGWPEVYQDTLVYADITGGVLGFAKLSRLDEMVEDFHRVRIPESVIQIRVGPDDALYYTNIRGTMRMIRLSYEPIQEPLTMISSTPPVDSTFELTPFATIEMTFNKPLDPRYVKDRIRLQVQGSNVIVPSVVNYRFHQSVVEIIPLAPYERGKRYRVVIPRSVRDLEGNRAIRVSWSFRAGGRVRPPPVITNYVPETLSINFPIGNWMSVTFDQAMNSSSLTERVTVHEAQTGNVPTGDRIPILTTDIRANRFRFKAVLRYNTSYVVTVPGGDEPVFSRAGTGLETSLRYTFTTADPPPTDLVLTIANPPEDTRTNVGDSIPFAGNATFRGVTVPESAFEWNQIMYHCKYASSQCHDHPVNDVNGRKSGTFTAVNHLDKYYYEVIMKVAYEGQQASASVVVLPNTVPVTLESDPPGIELTLNGYSAFAPYTVDVAVFSTIQLFAARENGDMAFDRWTCGGERVQERTTPNTPFACTAIYILMQIRELSSVVFVDNPIPLEGIVEVDIRYRCNVPAQIGAGLRTTSGVSLGGRVRSVPSSDGELTTVGGSFRLTQTLVRGKTYILRVVIRPEGTGRPDDTIELNIVA